jgi:hypothetical protein
MGEHMTQDEIIEMAIKSHLVMANYSHPTLLDFAKLVAQHEREACAEVCKKHADVYAKLEGNPTAKTAWAACIDNRDAIKARGQA